MFPDRHQVGYTNTLHQYTGSTKTENKQQCVFYCDRVRSQEVPMAGNDSLGLAQGGLWKGFWWLGKSQYSSGTCEMGSPLPGVISLAPGRGDMRLPVDTYLWLHIKAHAGLPTTSQCPGHPGRPFPLLLHCASSQPAAGHRPPF